MWVKIKRSVVINFFLLSLTLLIGYGALRGVLQALELRKEAKGKEKKIEELLEKKVELERYLAELENAEVVKREAKERLNLKEPGENVVVVVPVEEETSPTEPVAGNFWAKIKMFVSSFFRNIL